MASFRLFRIARLGGVGFQRTVLHVHIGAMTDQKSIGTSFWNNMYVLFRGTMVAEFMFMDDNARPHRANIVNKCLQSEDISCIDWPPDFTSRLLTGHESSRAGAFKLFQLIEPLEP
ncbi:hypothetical protein TNCV_2493401 [Trichonephila clavipes]|uniref:Uncharacterized protein n=1 Tax=Trichonephila clavipes TaxID=2585209 RepID=A0A8X6RUL3_TRICX|nr:hypothetical protein TNCV_2493401 [Trichonephila clavipes]